MLILSYLLTGTGFFIFMSLRSDRLWLFPFYFILFGVGQASWVVLSQTVVADYYGTARFATLRGLAQLLSLPISVAMPVLAGWLFDLTGNYQTIFTLCGIFTLCSGICQLLIRRPQWSEIERRQTEPETAGARS